MLLQHVSTQKSHHQADYLRNIKCIILYSIIHVTIALGILYALHWVSRKSGFVTNLAVVVVIATVCRLARTSQQWGGGGGGCVPPFCLFTNKKRRRIDRKEEDTPPPNPYAEK